jgi:hypothetical protein
VIVSASRGQYLKPGSFEPGFFSSAVISSPDVFIAGIFHLPSTVRGLTMRGRPTIIAT